MTDIFSADFAGKARRITGKEVISEENGIVHLGMNEERNRIWQYHLDGDVYERNKPPIRCDYLLLNETRGKAFFIELKGVEERADRKEAGKKYSHAMKQIDTSYEDIWPSLPEKGYEQYYFRIVYKGTQKTKPSILRKWENKAPYARKALPSGEPDDID